MGQGTSEKLGINNLCRLLKASCSRFIAFDFSGILFIEGHWPSRLWVLTYQLRWVIKFVCVTPHLECSSITTPGCHCYEEWAIARCLQCWMFASYLVSSTDLWPKWSCLFKLIYSYYLTRSKFSTATWKESLLSLGSDASGPKKTVWYLSLKNSKFK